MIRSPYSPIASIAWAMSGAVNSSFVPCISAAEKLGLGAIRIVHFQVELGQFETDRAIVRRGLNRIAQLDFRPVKILRLLQLVRALQIRCCIIGPRGGGKKGQRSSSGAGSEQLSRQPPERFVRCAPLILRMHLLPGMASAGWAARRADKPFCS